MERWEGVGWWEWERQTGSSWWRQLQQQEETYCLQDWCTSLTMSHSHFLNCLKNSVDSLEFLECCWKIGEKEDESDTQWTELARGEENLFLSFTEINDCVYYIISCKLDIIGCSILWLNFNPHFILPKWYARLEISKG